MMKSPLKTKTVKMADSLSCTSRQIVQQTLDFEGPARLAHSFAPSDFVSAAPVIPNPLGDWRKISEREWRRIDEWGNEWARIDDSSMGEVVKGALEDLDDISSLPLPTFSESSCYSVAREMFSSRPDQWHIGSTHGFTFSVARKIRRLDQYLQDLLLEPDEIRSLHDRVDERIVDQIQGMHQAGADCIMIAEDWGTQTQTLINPRLWRAEFKPRFKDLCKYAHSLGLRVFMHSCGNVTAIVPDLVEVGVDVLQFDQPLIHGIDMLRAWRDQWHVTFWCPVDIQASLQCQNEQIVRQAARDLVDNLWRGEGGFIAGYYSDNKSIGLEPKWQEIASDEFSKHATRFKSSRV